MHIRQNPYIVRLPCSVPDQHRKAFSVMNTNSFQVTLIISCIIKYLQNSYEHRNLQNQLTNCPTRFAIAPRLLVAHQVLRSCRVQQK